MAKHGANGGTHLVDEEESYFVSMTDMMVGIIFIFVILLMTFALSYREAEEERESKVEQLENVETAKQEILTDIKRALKENGIEVKIDLENGIMHLPEKILFSSGSAMINVRGRESLGHLARALYAVVPCYAAVADRPNQIDCSGRTEAKLDAVFVEGHTDSVPIGNHARLRDNWELSAQRAIETYKELIGIEPRLDELKTEPRRYQTERTPFRDELVIDPSFDDSVNAKSQKLFSVSGYGEFRPLADNATEEGRRANRRIDLRFLMRTPRSLDMKLADKKISEEASANGT